MESVTVPAAQFKATCLELLDNVADRKVDRVVITKHGRVVGVLYPPPASSEDADRLFGMLASRTFIAEGVDLTEPTMDEPLSAAEGKLHE